MNDGDSYTRVQEVRPSPAGARLHLTIHSACLHMKYYCGGRKMTRDLSGILRCSFFYGKNFKWCVTSETILKLENTWYNKRQLSNKHATDV